MSSPSPSSRPLYRTTIALDALVEAAAALREANAAFAARYPGDSPGRQPVHVVYGGANRFTWNVANKLGGLAIRSLETHLPTPAALGDALGIATHASLATIRDRVMEKLLREPVEDYRVDFEDGYGSRPDDEEDRDAGRVAQELAEGMRRGSLPSFIGIRVKPLSEETRARSVRTLDIILTALAARDGLPDGWVITLPKITLVEQVQYFVAVAGILERELGLGIGSLRFEIMVEAPQVIVDRRGRSLLPSFVDAAEGRLRGAHFGAYDYTAACDITASCQRMRHPSCEFAKAAMQAALAGTGVRLSDGATSVMPLPVHHAVAGGAPLTERQIAENTDAMRAAWRLHFDDVRHSLAGGFYQGWDLHPAQLISRYAAVFSFFLEGINDAGARLRNFVESAAQATLVGNTFDDAATGQGLLNFFLRGVNSGAITEAEALATTGLTTEEIRGRSFTNILSRRAAIPTSAA